MRFFGPRGLRFVSVAAPAPGPLPFCCCCRLRPLCIQQLYRYQHDPTPKVQQSMRGMWQALVPDHKATVEQYFDPIMQARSAVAPHCTTPRDTSLCACRLERVAAPHCTTPRDSSLCSVLAGRAAAPN